jgi:ethanolamine utilization protein EutN
MYLGVVTGTVVAARKAAGLEGTKLLLVQPVDDTGKHTGDVQVAVDTVRAGVGDHVYLVGSREAALACDPWFVPVDAAIVGIVDDVHTPERAATVEPVDDDPTEANPTPPARKAPVRAKKKTGDA